ncbi:MAG: hypothetical protein RLZZ326_1377 [Planctomycetota bacterium]|jgi:4-hydroxybenzoate polyprenyltransferase
MAEMPTDANPPPHACQRRTRTIDGCRQLIALARVREWIFSKIVFAVVGIVLLGDGSMIGQSLAIVIGTMALMAFGFGINEIADESTDLRAGKGSRAAELPEWLGRAFLGLAALTTVGAAIRAKPDSLSVGLALVYLLIAWQYSCTPLRLKERGLWGIVAAALAQWTFPVAMIYACGNRGVPSPAIACFGCLSLALGIRWEGIHQSADLASDHRAGVTTFTASGGNATRLVHWSYIVELAFGVGTWASLWNDSRVPAVAFMLWCAFVPFLTAIRGMPFPEQIMRYDTEPLGPFYFRALPLALFLQAQLGWKTVPAAVAAVTLAVLTKILPRRRDPSMPCGAKAPPRSAERPE